MSDENFPGPPPPVDFRIHISQYVAQAMIAMGKMQHPGTGKTSVDLAWAQYFIDLLGLIETKTEGNLDAAEQAELDRNLTTLRLTFVETKKDLEAEGGASADSDDSSAD